jgi:hypothetical protein
MGFAPSLDPLHVLSVAEVISVACFSQPAPLTGGFAGPATSRSQTEKLTAGIMNVGNEKYFAAAALASVVLGTHRPPSGKKTGPTNQSKNSSGRREENEEGRKVFAQNLEENQREEKTISNRRFSPAIIPPLTPCVRLTALTSLRQPNARAAAVWFTSGPCRFPSRLAETTSRPFRPLLRPAAPTVFLFCFR